MVHFDKKHGQKNSKRTLGIASHSFFLTKSLWVKKHSVKFYELLDKYTEE